MALDDLDTQDDGNLGRKSVLERLLAEFRAPDIERVSRAEYAAWDSRQRAEFDDRRIERIANSFIIETPPLRNLIVELRRAAAYSRRTIGRTGVAVSGPPATGKTSAAFHGMVDGFRRHEKRYPEWRDLGHTPVVYIELPPGANGKTTMGRFMHFFELPVLERFTLEARTQIVTEHLIQARTSLIVIDEMQNLERLSNGNFESAQALKNLLNSVKAVPLYLGFKLDKILSNDEIGGQFAGRSTLITLDRFPVDTDRDQELWSGLIRLFEDQFALFEHPSGTLEPHADYIWRRTKGSIAALSRLLTTAALDVIQDPDASKETITVARLETIQMDLRTMLEEEPVLAGR